MQLLLLKEEDWSPLAEAETMREEKLLIVCDRGVMDNKAYMTEVEFQALLRAMELDAVTLRDGYDGVFHLVTAAKGAEEFYTLSNNRARTETPEQARELDDRLIAAWTGHPHLRILREVTEDERYKNASLASGAESRSALPL